MLLLLNVLFATFLGAFVGKYLAMVAQYLPKILFEEIEEQEPGDIIKWFFQKPRCRNCSHPMSWRDGTPIFGFFSTKGKCSHCHQSHGIKFFLIEAGTALLFGGSVLFFPINASLLFVLIVCCLLICCFVTDCEHGILPDQLTFTIIWVGLIGSLFPIFVGPKEAIIGAVGGYSIFWFFNAIYYYIRGFDGMFPGDFKLNAGIGACVGMTSLIFILMTSLILLLIVTTIQFFLTHRTIDASILYQEVPYGCYSTIVTGVVLYLTLSGTLT